VDILAAIDRSMPWVDEASCRDSDRNWVVDPTIDRHAPATVYSLLVICAQCPVRRACLDYALSSQIECVGVWGASTTFERRSRLPLHNSSAWLFGDTRRRAIEHALEKLETGLPARLHTWRRRALRHNKAQVDKGTKPPRYPVGPPPAIA
jgi:WhiB family redox-sensing transcriptional regulator